MALYKQMKDNTSISAFLAIQVYFPQAQQLVVEARADNRLHAAATWLNIASVIHALVLFEAGGDSELPLAVRVFRQLHDATSGVHAAREDHEAESCQLCVIWTASILPCKVHSILQWVADARRYDVPT